MGKNISPFFLRLLTEQNQQTANRQNSHPSRGSIVKLYTLFKTQDPENHIMYRGTMIRIGQIRECTPGGQGTLSCHESISLRLDSYLSWNDHIDYVYIGCKILAKLGMLRKACKVIPHESCLTLYNVMILVWDSCGKADWEYLDKLQRRTASIIEGCTVSKPQISRTFGWPTLQSRLDYVKCMLVFKSLHGLAPADFLNEFSHLRIPKHTIAKTTKYQGSLRLSGAKICNTLPLELRSEHDINKFASGLKKHFRSKPNCPSANFF